MFPMHSSAAANWPSRLTQDASDTGGSQLSRSPYQKQDVSSLRKGFPMHRAFQRTVALLSTSAAAFVLAVAPVSAQIPSPPVENEELQGRLERLEKQNKDLSDSLRELHGLLAKRAATPPRNADALWQGNEKEMPAGADLDPALVNQILQKSMPPADGEPGISKQDVEGIVNNWWSAKEKAKKEADELKKLEDEARGYEVGKDLALKTVWNHGLWAESADKSFRVHVGGRAQFDTIWMDGDRSVEFGSPGGTEQIRDAAAFRRGRLAVEGTFWEVINFNTEFDFTNTAGSRLDQSTVINTPVPTDLWIEITKLPILGNVRFGNQKPQISFEHLTSSRFLNFLERSFMFDAWIGGLNNGFLPGVQVWNYSRDERMTWSLGVYKNNGTVFGWNVGGGELDCTGRVTWLPVYQHEGRCLVHLGLGASFRDPDEGKFRQRARTMLRNGPPSLHTPLVDTTFNTSNQIVVVPEFAMVWGPFSMVAEYYGTWFSDTAYVKNGNRNVGGFIGGDQFPGTGNVGTTFYQGAYVEALYFLTGEHRPYNKYGGSGAAFTRVIPHRPFYFVPGERGNLFSSGAWQVAARYQWIDLQDKDVPGGTLQDVTLGLNWFLNPNLKFQWNYTITHRNYDGNAADGDVQGAGMRVAWDF